ncbi:MAG: DNA replication/repair protein RecF [Gammaproteobacteria bacterium]|nr:DNA replication/repair protein RecF [Gammaproteobacteria bacterium]MDH5654109.1 DNA replication/repair protein RecF [Gammaproteobacteria bacterium]
MEKPVFTPGDAVIIRASSQEPDTMTIQRLRVQHVRNLSAIDIEPHPQLNILYGENASGKTSLLEAIHLLSATKSFRTHRIGRVIQYEQDKLAVFGQIQSGRFSHKIGIERSKKTTEIRIDGESVNQASIPARHLPLQLITPQVNSLLEQGPKMRRRFLDWGVFHVKHDYLNDWRAFHRVLQQRNASLRQKLPKSQVCAWDKALLEAAHKITQSREDYITALSPLLAEYSLTLFGQTPELTYQPGWSQDQTLEASLQAGFSRDMERGFTASGPHRAELMLKFHGVPAQDVLSRGQLKLCISAMQLAQVAHLGQERSQTCIILVDDLAAELDQSRRQALVQLLIQTGAQVFITVTEAGLLAIPPDQGHKMFHVEQGAIAEKPR